LGFIVLFFVLAVLMMELIKKAGSHFKWILVVAASIAAIFLIHNIILSMFYVFGPISHPGAFKYEIAITGIDSFSGNNLTRITIPLPMKENGRSIFFKQDINNRTFGIWTSCLIPVDGSMMIQFSTLERNLADIHAVFYCEEEGEMSRYRELSEEMCPYVANTTTPYTRWIYNRSIQEGPVTLVIIDPGMEPKDAQRDLAFDLEFYAGGGTVSSQERDWYRLSIVEDIPSDVTGNIPVRVQTGKYVNNRWTSFQ
jgi:hypothetical protein